VFWRHYDLQNVRTTAESQFKVSWFKIFLHFRFFFCDLSFINFRFFPSFKTWKFGPYTVLEPQFRVQVYNFGLDCTWCIDYVQWKWSNVKIDYELIQHFTISFKRVSINLIGQKACGRSHSHRSMFITEQCYLLIMNRGCKLPHDWSSYTMLIEELTHRMPCAVKP
jgi:hypothetical protein